MQNQKVALDIRARCYNFSLEIIALTNSLPNKRSCWIITDQLIRSATSIGANLAEGKAASSRLEFKKFYEIALKSANETVYWLELLYGAQHISKNVFETHVSEAKQLANMLASGVIKLKQKRF